MRGCGLPPRCRWDVRSSGILRSVEWPADGTDTYRWRWDRQAFPKRQHGITTLRCVISQNSAGLRKGNICSTYQRPIWIFTASSLPIWPNHLFHYCHRFCSSPLFWCGFWRPRAPRRRSAAARLLRTSDWNPAVGMDVSCEWCALSGRCLCDGPILCPGVLPNVCRCVIECDQMQQ